MPHPLILEFIATNIVTKSIYPSDSQLRPLKQAIFLCLLYFTLPQRNCTPHVYKHPGAPCAAHFHERTPTNPASHYQEWPLE